MATKNFFQDAIAKLSNLKRLDVHTIVGDYQLAGATKKIDPETADQRMSSQIDLMTGDITTAMTPKFVDEYKELREYHLIRENQGHEIIRRNIAVAREIGEALIQWNKDINTLNVDADDE